VTPPGRTRGWRWTPTPPWTTKKGEKKPSGCSPPPRPRFTPHLRQKDRIPRHIAHGSHASKQRKTSPSLGLCSFVKVAHKMIVRINEARRDVMTAQIHDGSFVRELLLTTDENVHDAFLRNEQSHF